jgi:uncharacterized protein involved in exopolysaccharide biosynthesis
MKNKTVFLTLIVAGIFSSFVFADVQNPPTTPMPAGIDQEQMKKQQEQMRQQQDQMMEQMKKQNPQMYEQMKTAQESQEKIIQVVTDFQAGKISYDVAKAQLHSPVEQQLKLRAANIDGEIAQMEKRIEQLKNFKANFSEAVDKAIDVRLGKAQPDPTMVF